MSGGAIRSEAENSVEDIEDAVVVIRTIGTDPVVSAEVPKNIAVVDLAEVRTASMEETRGTRHDRSNSMETVKQIVSNTIRRTGSVEMLSQGRAAVNKKRPQFRVLPSSHLNRGSEGLAFIEL